MAESEASTVIIENGPATEQARIAAETATLAAAQAIESATEIGAAAQRAAASEVREIAEETAEELAEQEDDLQWLKDHARSSGEHQSAVTQTLQSQQMEISGLRETLAELRTGIQTILSLQTPPPPVTEASQEVTPPPIPPEGEGESRAPQTARKRRLI